MPYRHFATLLMILATIMLSACQSDNETPQLQPSSTEAITVTPEIPASSPQESTISIEEPVVQPTTKPINLEVTQQSLEQLYNDEDQQIAADAPVRITKQSDGAQKTKISGGVLLDEEGSVMNDGVDSIDGAEVKISIPLH